MCLSFTGIAGFLVVIRMQTPPAVPAQVWSSLVSGPFSWMRVVPGCSVPFAVEHALSTCWLSIDIHSAVSVPLHAVVLAVESQSLHVSWSTTTFGHAPGLMYSR